jgi:hypothetical protein
MEGWGQQAPCQGLRWVGVLQLRLVLARVPGMCALPAQHIT